MSQNTNRISDVCSSESQYNIAVEKVFLRDFKLYEVTLRSWMTVGEN